MSKGTVAGIVIVLLFIAIVSPILFIWSLNTLFGLNIAYGFFEWLAALLLIGALKGNGIKFKAD